MYLLDLSDSIVQVVYHKELEYYRANIGPTMTPCYMQIPARDLRIRFRGFQSSTASAMCQGNVRRTRRRRNKKVGESDLRI